MTIASQISTASFAGNGVTVSFPLPFRFLAAADVAVVLRGADGTETLLGENTDYTLSGAGAASGGACLLASPPLAGQTLVLTRAPRIVQETDYQENDAFPAESHEAALDLLTMVCQALDERLGRAALLPVSCGLRGPVLAEPVPGRALAWDAQGRVLAAGPSTAEIASAQGHAEAAAEARNAAEQARDQAQAAADSAEARPAASVPYDGTESGLAAADVQQALDALAARGVEAQALDELRTLLLAEALRRAIGDSVDGREFLGNGWIDPLADAGEVTLTNGSFVSSDGGYLTNAGASGQVAAFDLTAAQFLDEKDGIATFTVDTANTSGHFDAAAGARVQAGCRIVVDGASCPIVSITGDGTAADSVVFSGTLATGAKTVGGIYGLAGASGGSLGLSVADSGPALVTLTAAMMSKSANIGDWNAAQLVDGNTGTTGFTAGSAGTSDSIEINLAVAADLCRMDIYTDGNGTSWYIQYYNGSAWVTVATIDCSGTAGWKSAAWTGPGARTRWRITPVAAPGSGPNYKELRVYQTGVACPVSAQYPALVSLDCTDWAAITAFARSETLNGQAIHAAASFDGGTTYSAFTGSAWLPIARNNAGTWEYWTGSAWAASAVNSALGAMAQAAAVAGNRMTLAALAALTPEQIAGSGGFAGGQTVLPVLLAFSTSSAQATPVLSALSAQAGMLARDMAAEFDAFEAADPDLAKVVLVLQAVDHVTLDADLKAWVRRGEGAYAQVPLAVDSAFDAGRVLVAGDLDQGAGSGASTRLRLTSHNHKEVRIYGAANCFRSA